MEMLQWKSLVNGESIVDAEDINKIANYANELNLGKVDKESGMGLSSNDFTDDEKEKLANLSGFDGYYDVDGFAAGYREGIYKAKKGFVIQVLADWSEGPNYYDVYQYWYAGDNVYYRNLGDEYGFDYEWEKISVSQTDLDNAIGDVETSLENIIEKYGLGGDGV